MAYTNLPIHFVWSTKDRRPWITESLENDLYAYIGGILRKRKHVLLDAGGVADHVHLLVGMHQSQSVADFVRDVKSNSSGWIHEQDPKLKAFGWQTKYGAFAVSQSNVDAVKAYIGNQKEHHKRFSFKDELITLLQKHGIAFDEQYVFE